MFEFVPLAFSSEFIMDFDSINNSDDSDVSRGYISDFQFSPNSEIYISNCMPKTNGPYIEILEQPGDYRYRYEKEKYHGNILGLSSPPTKKKDSLRYPAVKVCNYDGDVIVRCWLISTDLNGTPKAHFHKLNRKLPKGEIQLEPHDIHATQKNDHVATFDYMYIVHAVEKDKEDLQLYEKKKCWLESGSFSCPDPCVPCLDKDELKTLDKNQSILLFQAFDAKTKERICESLISRKIKNLHNPVTAALKIVNYSLTSGSCKGGDEVFMFFEKISKDVEVRVFCYDTNGKRIWDEKTIYNPSNIHHQCGIVFKTPPFMNTDIKEPVLAYFELYRKSDGARSEPKKFTFQPHEHCIKKNFIKKRAYQGIKIKEDPMMCEFPSKKTKVSDHYVITRHSLGNVFIGEDLFNGEFPITELVYPNSNSIEIGLGDEFGTGEMYPPQVLTEENLCQNGWQGNLPDLTTLINGEIESDGVDANGIHVNRKLILKGILNEDVSEDAGYDFEKTSNGSDPVEESPIPYDEDLKIMEKLTGCINFGDLKTFEEILKSNESFDINSVDFGGNSIFLIACSQSLEFVKYLLKNKKVEQNITNLDGDNALLCAVRYEETNIVKELLHHKFDANVKNYKSGQTPLHVAVEAENLSIVKILIEFGANPLLEDSGSKSPYDYSVESRNTELRNFMYLKAQEHFSNKKCVGDSSACVTTENLDSQLQNLALS